MNLFKYIAILIWRLWFYCWVVGTVIVIFPVLLIVTSKESWYPSFYKIAHAWGKTLLFIMGFKAKVIAEEQKVDIKFFNIIYEALDYVEKSLSGLLEPDIKETVLGSAEIQKVFKVSTAGKIAGSKVISGEIKSKSKARIIRDGIVVYNGEILTIYREKNQVKEVGTGIECGISIKDFIDFKEKDVIESYLFLYRL